MSRRAWNLLTRGGALADPPQTVGDVLDLCVRRELGEIPGIGPRHVSEIEAALVLAGFDLTALRDRRP